MNVTGAGWMAPSRKVASRSSFWVASSWGDWLRTALETQGRRPREEVAVGRHPRRALEGVAEEERERPAMLAVANVFLRFLIVAAGREQNMPPLRRGVPARAFRRDASAGGCRLGFGYRDEERLDRPAAEVRRRAADDGLDLAGARAGVAAVEDHGDMRALRGHVADQLGDLLVGEVPASRAPAIEQHERLVKVVGFELPELFGGLLLRAVPAVVEERDVPLLRLARGGR